jgi:O-antigen/teichoic acid export membrane protein
MRGSRLDRVTHGRAARPVPNRHRLPDAPLRQRATCSPSCDCPDPASCPALADEAWQARQRAGLASLYALAAPVPFALSDAAAPVLHGQRFWPPEGGANHYSSDVETPLSPDTAAAREPIGRLLERWQNDHLLRNSLYLMLNTGIQATLGFAFWIIMARLFSTEDVGRASSLMSATALISYFALIGLNTTLVRFLPTANDFRELITAALLMVAAFGAVISCVYVLLTPFIVPQLAFVAHKPLLALGFIILTAAAAVNLISDSIFIAARRAGLCAITDGAVGATSKILLGILLTGTGAYGLYSASTAGMATAAVVSIILIVKALGWRPSFTNPFSTLKPLLKFSGANYVANALNLLPSVVVPIIVLDRLGARPAAYYFVSFQMASILYSAIFAVEQSFLAEGSQTGADWRTIRRRSRRLAVALFVPGGIILFLTSHWVLLAFGVNYSQHGTRSLEILATAVIPMAAANWSWTVLRISARLRALVASNIVYSVGICSSAWFLSAHGLTAMTAAWLIGSTLAAVVATAATTVFNRRQRSRHRRRARQGPLVAP